MKGSGRSQVSIGSGDGRRRLLSLSSARKRQLVPPPQHISLHRLMLDVYEFHGLTMLLTALLFFMVATGFLYSQWGGFTSYEPAFKSTVVESMKVRRLLAGDDA